MPLPTPAEQRQLAEINPEIAAYMSTPAFSSSTKVDYTNQVQGILDLRVLLRKLGAAPPDPLVTDSHHTYPTRDGTPLALTVYTPASATPDKPLPLLVWYYGGGGCCGASDISPAFNRSIALTQNCVVICPEYRLAPEHAFPTGIDDCWDALQHIATHASSFNASPESGFVIGGESFGAVISAVTQLRARDEGLSPPLTGAFLSAGSYIPPQAVPEQYKNHYISRFDPVCLASPGLSAEAKAAFDAALRPDYSSPAYRAILWPSGHRGLAKTYFQTCGMDINRDESFVYRDVLEKDGVDTRLDVYPGCPHCFWWTFANTQMAQRWREDTVKGFAWLFGRE